MANKQELSLSPVFVVVCWTSFTKRARVSHIVSFEDFSYNLNISIFTLETYVLVRYSTGPWKVYYEIRGTLIEKNMS